jgi:N-acetylglucosamine-6-sulfatase
VVSFHGPHIPAFFDAADAHRFADLKAPRVPSWGVSDADDPQYVKNQAPLTAEEARAADTLYRKKARSILAIRRAIVDVVKKFEEKGQLDNTYFVFTSDNGYRHGEHAMVHGKHTPYEEDINVPLFVRGPDVSQGVRLPNFALNTKEELYPESPHLSDNAYEVRPGWWVDTHASKSGIETRIKMACEVAGVKYGKDLVVDLG